MRVEYEMVTVGEAFVEALCEKEAEVKGLAERMDDILPLAEWVGGMVTLLL
jgi:hypothetical protein